MSQFHGKIFIVRAVLAFRPSSVTGNLRERYLKLSVTEDGLATETGLTINILLWNWHIIYPKSHLDKN